MLECFIIEQQPPQQPTCRHCRTSGSHIVGGSEDAVTVLPAHLQGAFMHNGIGQLEFDIRLITPLHPSSEQAMERIRRWQPEDDIYETYLYVDGTSGATKGLHTPGPPACGVCVVHHLSSLEYVFGGYFGALIPTDCNEAGYRLRCSR